MTAEATINAEVIAAKVYNPAEPSIFGKGKKSDRATYSEISCSCESCPLRANRTCIMISIFRSHCPYGKYTTHTGPTQRSNGYSQWVREHREKASPLGWLGFAPTKLAFIGEYVYLPYAHADMCGAVPFTRHSAFFVSGVPLVKRCDWTIENVLMLIDFRPRSMMGDEIRSYQAEQVPLLLAHIREVDADMWAQLIAARPDLNTEPNYVGRKALLRTLAHPIKIPPHDNRYPVSWLWDGETLTTTDKDSYSSTWGRADLESLVLTAKPSRKAVVIVRNNAWVTSSTEFVD